MLPLRKGTFDSRDSTKFQKSYCLVSSQSFLEKHVVDDRPGLRYTYVIRDSLFGVQRYYCRTGSQNTRYTQGQYRFSVILQ